MQRAVRNALARTTGKRKTTVAADAALALRLVAVGDLPDDIATHSPDLAFLAFHDVSAASLAVLAPDVVLSPLVADGFDCFDLAHALAEAGFRGRYRAAAVYIPDPGLVRREIRASFPDLDFDIIVIRARGDGRDH